MAHHSAETGAAKGLHRTPRQVARQVGRQVGRRSRQVESSQVRALQPANAATNLPDLPRNLPAPRPLGRGAQAGRQQSPAELPPARGSGGPSDEPRRHDRDAGRTDHQEYR